MKTNYSYAGIAVALQNGCRLTACMRQADQLDIVEVSITKALALNRGLWVQSFASNLFFEGALDEADAAYCYHLPEWRSDPNGQERYRSFTRNYYSTPLDRWVKLGGELRLSREHDRYTFELQGTGEMPTGWRVLRLSSQGRLHAAFVCANEIAQVELGGVKLPNLQIQVVA